MINIDILMIGYLILICAVAAVTDWKFGKIYNKWLTIGMCPGIVLVISYYFGNPDSIWIFFYQFLCGSSNRNFVFYMEIMGSGRFEIMAVY